MMLIVPNGLVPEKQQQLFLHPALLAWQKALINYRQQWFTCSDKNPLAWYAALAGISPALLLAAECEALPDDMQQCWVASPYCGQLVRHHVRVLPEGQFPWCAEDARDLCHVLNPLLAADGMQMFAVGAALLLACREPVEACPAGFGAISGQLLPDRHHEGADGGRLNRLLSEIQMLLFQSPITSRLEQGLPEVNGIWLWAPTAISQQSELTMNRQQIAVATRNPALQSVADATDATDIISEAERLSELLKPDAPLPKCIVLAGGGHAVYLSRSILPHFGKRSWQPKSSRDEQTLLSKLRSTLHISVDKEPN